MRFHRFKNLTNTIAVRSIRSGLVAIIPILMIGAFSLALRSLPITRYQAFIHEGTGELLYSFFNSIYNVTYGLLAVYMAMAIGYFYGKFQLSAKSREPYGFALVSLLCFFLLSGLATGADISVAFGARGMFTSICSSLACSSIYSRLLNITGHIRLLTDGDGLLLSGSVQSILPCTLVVALFASLNLIAVTLTGATCVNDLLLTTLNNILIGHVNSFPGGLLFVLSSSLLWFFGIHGSDVLEVVSNAVYVPAMEANTLAVQSGLPAQEILTKPFFDIFVLMGGCGSSLCLLCALLFFSKRKSNLRLARISIFPMLFNINEIMIFGLPVIYNLTLLIPFICVPIFCFVSSYLAMLLGIVPLTVNSVEWVTPIFIGGYMATGSIAGVLLQLFNLVAGVFIYRPFVLRYDNEKLLTAKSDYDALVSLLQESENNRRPVVLTDDASPCNTMAMALSADLIQAMDNDELNIYFQPQYRLDGSCLGGEALLRWNHPLFGMIYPPLIIQLAEEAGRRLELEKKILLKSSSTAHELEQLYGKRFKISVNVTGSSIQSSEFESFLQQLATEISPAKCGLCLELTEQAALMLTDDVEQRLSRIRGLGFPLIMDDFSMGHTSLQYLMNNHFDTVKLDGSLVAGVADNPRCRDIISSIIQLSGSLHFEVLAEYVSNARLRDELARLGCILYQGWLYSPAIPREDFLQMLQAEGKKQHLESSLKK